MASTFQSYQWYLEETEEPMVSAILVLADAVKTITGDDMLAHQLSLGIRKGLYGAAAGDNESINIPLESIATEISGIPPP